MYGIWNNTTMEIQLFLYKGISTLPCIYRPSQADDCLHSDKCSQQTKTYCVGPRSKVPVWSLSRIIVLYSRTSYSQCVSLIWEYKWMPMPLTGILDKENNLARVTTCTVTDFIYLTNSFFWHGTMGNSLYVISSEFKLFLVCCLLQILWIM